MSLFCSDPYRKAYEIALADIDDPVKVRDYGILTYKRYANMDKGYVLEQSHLDYIDAFADLLHCSFSKITNDQLFEIKAEMEGKGRYIEPSLWESPNYWGDAHLIVQENNKEKRTAVLLEMLLMSHDIENYVRPNLMRMHWLIGVGVGESTLYSDSQLDYKGRLRSMGDVIIKITNDKKLLPNTGISSKSQITLDELFEGFCEDSGAIGIDNLRNWIDHRNFFIVGGSVKLPINGGKTLKASFEEINNMMLMTVDLARLMETFQWMFIAHISARVGEPEPYSFAEYPRSPAGI